MQGKEGIRAGRTCHILPYIFDFLLPTGKSPLIPFFLFQKRLLSCPDLHHLLLSQVDGRKVKDLEFQFSFSTAPRFRSFGLTACSIKRKAGLSEVSSHSPCLHRKLSRKKKKARLPNVQAFTFALSTLRPSRDGILQKKYE